MQLDQQVIACLILAVGGFAPGCGSSGGRAGDAGDTTGDQTTEPPPDAIMDTPPPDAPPPDAPDAIDVPPDSSGTHAIQTVFIILMENHNWNSFFSNIVGNSSAPYINNTLMPMSAYATDYNNPPYLHPSEPNYLWLEAGDNFGVRDDNPPSSNHQATPDHLVTYLDRAGISWRSYQEDITGADCPLTDEGAGYAPKHNPMVFFDDVTNTNDAASTYCIAHVRPYSELATDLTAGTVARYNFITPDLCHDMHDSCAPLNDAVAQGDQWLQTNIPMITASAAYTTGGAIFVTWDEGYVISDGPIGMLVISPFGKGGGYNNAIHYTHSSTLRTMQEIFGVSPLLRDAAAATDLSDLFTTFP